MKGLKLHVPRYGTAVPGLPTKAIVITNSERRAAACPSKWLFGYADRLAPLVKAWPLQWGTAWHDWQEDLHRWWMVHDTTYPGDGSRCVWCDGTGAAQGDLGTGHCDQCSGTGDDPLGRTLAAWVRQAADDETGEFDHDQAVKMHTTLVRAAEGWLHIYGSAPMEDYRVVGVELRLAVPVLTPTGAKFRPQTWVCPEGTGIRLAGTGEAHSLGARIVRWPWYQALTLDALFQHRENGGLYVREHKSAASPTSRVQSILMDPQLAGYVWATGVAARTGLLSHLGVPANVPVVGYQYDVTSNKLQHDPVLKQPEKVKALHPDTGEPHKKGSRWVYELDGDGVPVTRSQLSRNTGAGVPTWRYRAAIAQHGLDPADYESHLLALSAVDAKLYKRLNGTSGPEVSARYERELYGTARMLSAWRRKAATLTTQAERELQFPRQPVCITGHGNCPFAAPCLQDGELVRRNYGQAETQRWVSEQTTLNDENGELGW